MSWHNKKGNVLPKKDLPKFDESKIEIIKSVDWYDGPLCGWMEYEGKKYWFDLTSFCFLCDDFCECEDSGRHYFYQIYPIKEDMDITAKREDINFTGVNPVGWFTDGCNQNFYGIMVCYNKCPEGKCTCAIIKEKK